MRNRGGKIFSPGGFQGNVGSLHDDSYENVPGRYVDIVKDVINIVSCHVSADKLVSLIEGPGTSMFMSTVDWHSAQDQR